MGERADAGMVREGAQAASVEGRMFSDAGFPGFEDAAEEGLIASRRLGADGRSRAQLDGRMCTNRQLADVVGARIDLCGQHEHQQLLKAANHMDILDAWAGDAVDMPLRAYGEAFDAARAAAAELSRIEEAAHASSAVLDEARFTLARIDEIAPYEGEYEELMERLPLAENAESLAGAANAAYSYLSGDGAAVDSVNAAASALDAVSSVDPRLGEAARSLRDASYVLEDVARDMRTYRDGLEFDPESLAEMQARASALQGLMRTYGPSMADVLERRRAAAEAVGLADDSEARVSAAREALAAAEERLAKAAEELKAARHEAAPRFARAVTDQMARLDMGSAMLVCDFSAIERGQWTRTRPESMEFMYRPGAGMQARPLARIASGGEVSRVMLACKVVLGERDAAETLVFDEVDAGVGGATAVALADVLADLARTHQVIVITHLAQVAVRGQRHYRVSKTAGDMPETRIEILEGDDRVAEVARMLSGDATGAALAHAREMIGQFDC